MRHPGRQPDPHHREIAKYRGFMIRQARKHLRMQQIELASLMGVGQQAVYQWECGRRMPTKPTWKLFELLCQQKGIKFDKSGIILTPDSPSLDKKRKRAA